MPPVKKGEPNLILNAPRPVRQPFNSADTTGDYGMGSAFNMGNRGVNAKAEFIDNGGNIFGARGNVGFDGQNVINPDSANAALYAKLNPMKGLDVQASIDKDRFWKAAAQYKLNDKLGFEASTNADKEWEVGANFAPTEDSMIEGSVSPDLMRAAANWELKKNLALSANIAKRSGQKPRYGANIEYTF